MDRSRLFREAEKGNVIGDGREQMRLMSMFLSLLEDSLTAVLEAARNSDNSDESLERTRTALVGSERVVELIDVFRLQIPMSAYDPSVTNYSGARQALLAYEQHCEYGRSIRAR